MHRIYWLHSRALAMNSASSNKRHVALQGQILQHKEHSGDGMVFHVFFIKL